MIQYEVLLRLIDHVKHGWNFNDGDPNEKIAESLESLAILIATKNNSEEQIREIQDKYPEVDFLDDVIDDLDDLIKNSINIEKQDIIAALSIVMTKLNKVQTKVISDANYAKAVLEEMIY